MMIAVIGTENGAKYDSYGEHMKVLQEHWSLTEKHRNENWMYSHK